MFRKINFCTELPQQKKKWLKKKKIFGNEKLRNLVNFLPFYSRPQFLNFLYNEAFLINNFHKKLVKENIVKT